MRKIFTPMALVLLMGAAVSCKKNDTVGYVDPVINNPITDYDYTRDANDYFTYAFKNKSSNAVKTEWRFGDDTLTTVKDPSHTYLATGRYTVDLKNFSSSGTTTRKLINLDISPDSIMKLGSVRTASTSGTATLRFEIKVNAPVKTLVWKFEDVAYSKADGSQVAAKTEIYNATSATDVPSRTYASGTFNSVTITLTTTKGSVAVINRGVTTEGIAEDITQKRQSYKSFYENGDNPNGNESTSKLLDGNVNTKFGIYGKGSDINKWSFTLIYEGPVTAKLYMIANANDQDNQRDPKEWYLDGSNDGTNWVQLDYQNNGKGFWSKADDAGIKFDGSATNPGRYFRKWYYPIANQQSVSMYRLRFPSGSFNNSDIQLSEFALFR